MNPKSFLVVIAVLMVGVLGGAAAYQVAIPAGSADAEARESLALGGEKKAGKRNTKPAKFAPCKAPAVLEGGKCVTDVVRTVVVPGASTAAAGPRSGSSSGQAFSSSSHGHQAPVPVDTSGDDDETRHHSGDDDDHDHADDDNDGPGGGDDHSDDDSDHSGHGGGGEDDDTHTVDTSTQTQTRTGD